MRFIRFSGDYQDIVDSLLKHYLESHSYASNFGLLPLQELVLKNLGDFFSPRKNVILGGPTSSGKTFLAEIALLKEAIITERVSFYLAPTRALAQERWRKLLELTPEKIHSRIILSTGEDTESDRLLYQGNFDIACMVYEKANIVLSTGGININDLGLVVIDELHMMEDLHRGNIIELLIMKLIVARQKVINSDNFEIGHFTALPRFMVITTELTISAEEVKRWLSVSETNELVEFMVSERPVPVFHNLILPNNDDEKLFRLCPIITMKSQADCVLSQNTLERIGREIGSFQKNGGNRHHSVRSQTKQMGEQQLNRMILSLLSDLIENADQGTRILVFGNSKAGLLTLANTVKKHNQQIQDQEIITIPQHIEESIRKAEPSTTLRQLERLSRFGIYLHNADLDQPIRHSIETYFSNSNPEIRTHPVELLFATSTLSYGVNLSIDKVILLNLVFPSTDRHGDFIEKPLSNHEYHNMLGRTGRLGLARKPGEVFILCDMIRTNPRIDIIRKYYYRDDASPPKLTSQLAVNSDFKIQLNGSATKGLISYTYPYIRVVLDSLRHLQFLAANGDERLIPEKWVTIEQIVAFLESSYCKEIKIEANTNFFSESAKDILVPFNIYNFG